MQLRYLLFLVIFIVKFGQSFGQTQVIDSLKLQLSTETNDSLKGLILNSLAWEFKSRDLPIAESYCHQAIELTTNNRQIKQRSSAYNTLGLVKQEQNKLDEALKYLELSVKDKESVGDRRGLATVKNNIGVVYKLMGQIDRALSYYKEALNEHLELGNIRGQAECLNNIAIILRNKGELEQSNEYFLQAIEIRKKLNDKNGIALTYNNLSANATDQNKYKESINYLYESARLFEELGNKTALVTVYGNIGRLNRELKNMTKAIDYCKKAIDLAKTIGTANNLSNVYAVYGDVYYEMKKYPSARKVFKEGLKISLSSKNKEYEGYFHLGIGSSYLMEKNYTQALPELNQAIGLARKQSHSRNLARSLQKLAKYYHETNQVDKVDKPLDEAIRICKKNKYKDILAICYATKANNSDDKEKASSYLIEMNQLKDSIFNKDVASQFAEMQTKYETDKKEAEISVLKQQETIDALKLKEKDAKLFQQKTWLIIVIFGMIVILVLAYYIVTNVRLKSRIEKAEIQKTTEENERARIAKDIHDELGSGLSKIMFLTEIINEADGDKTKLQTPVKSISETSRVLIENMRDLIWAMNPDNTSLENLIVRIREYSADYFDDFPIEFTGEFPKEIPDIRISNEANRNSFMIVKEVLQNIVKHSGAKRVTMSVSFDKSFQIRIKDDGKGFNPSDVHTGNGLKNLIARSKAMKADLNINSSTNNGTEIIFTIEAEFLVRE